MEFIEQSSIIDVKTSNIIIEPDYVLYHGGCFDGFTVYKIIYKHRHFI
jgi:hypothetical protein